MIKTEQEFFRQMRYCIELYNCWCDETKNFTPFSGDHPSGTCFLFFQGDYEEVKKVREQLKLKTIENRIHKDL